MTMTTHTDPSPGDMRAAEQIADLLGIGSPNRINRMAAIIAAETGAAALAYKIRFVSAYRMLASAAKSIKKARMDAAELAELLEAYVVIEETAAPYSSSPLRARARAALDRYRKGGE